MFGGTINSSSRTNPRFRAIAQIIYNILVRPGYRTGNCASDHHYDAGNIYQHAYFLICQKNRLVIKIPFQRNVACHYKRLILLSS